MVTRRDAAGEGSTWLQVMGKTLLLFLVLTLFVSLVGLSNNNKMVEQGLLCAVVVVVSFYAGRQAATTFGGAERAGLAAGIVLLVLVCLCSALVYKTLPQVKPLLLECAKIFPAALLGSMKKEKKRGPRRK